MDWKAPADGGKPNAYKVMRRERPEGSWQEVATAIDSEATLVEQPRGKELEYRIVAINKSGDGEPSNTVMVVHYKYEVRRLKYERRQKPERFV